MVAALVLGVVCVPAPASAEPSLPTFDGVMSFPAIQGPLDPEEFSWEVELSDGQVLQLVDSQHAMVYYTEGQHPAFGIAVASAHDASGATVPTSLAVSGVNVVTLTVHHRAGNPLADGASFAYPVLPGSGWVVIDEGWIVGAPLKESVDEILERIALANAAAQVASLSSTPPRCLVPKLAGRSLAASRKRLGAANCKIGRVSKRRGATARTGKIVKQNPKAGVVLAGGASVGVTLGG